MSYCISTTKTYYGKAHKRYCFYFVLDCKGDASHSGYHGRIATTLGLESGNSTPIGYGPTIQSPIVLGICMPCNKRHIKDASMYLAYSSPRPCLMWLHYIRYRIKLGPKLIRSLHLRYLGQGRSYDKGGGYLV